MLKDQQMHLGAAGRLLKISLKAISCKKYQSNFHKKYQPNLLQEISVKFPQEISFSASLYFQCMLWLST